jgi:hypothetical protein
MYSFSKVCPLTNRDVVGNQAFVWKNNHGRPLAWALLSSSIRDKRSYMGRRCAAYTLAFVFLLSSVAFLCPDVYSFSTVSHHSSRAGKMPDRDPCGNTDNKASPSPCYRGLHDRLFPSATISGSLSGPGGLLLAADNSVLSGPVLPTQLPVWRSKSPPRLALTVLFPVLRI